MSQTFLKTATLLLVSIIGFASSPSAQAQHCGPGERLVRVETTTTTTTDADGNQVIHVFKKPICVRVPPPQMPGTAQQIRYLCRDLNRELNKMSQVNLKIVAMQFEAIGKLTIRVPVAVILGGQYEANDPPENVLREAHQTLRRIADLSQQVDVLNGKQAWAEEERRWVMDHIYVANASGNYSVGVSDQTARGQTAFAELRSMPKFQGCKADSKGRQFIPQVRSLQN